MPFLLQLPGSRTMEKMFLAIMASFMVLTINLVDSLLEILRVQHFQNFNVPIESSSLANSNCRKRRRDQSDDYVRVWQILRLKRSFLILHREISCPWYIKPRQFEWFGLFLDYLPTEDPERFKHFFRVSPSTFDSICEMVHDDMVTDPPRRFWSLPNRKLIVQRQVAIALRRLATGDQFVGIGELFGVSTSTVVKVTWKFIQAFNLRGRHLIKWPTGDDMTDVKAGFQRRGFPNCCGAVDGTHFPVELPMRERSEDYFDFKHKLSVSMQAVVDCKLRFLDVLAGWPGSIQDTRLMRNSQFYRSVVYTRTRLDGQAVVIDDTYLKEYILGDAGYPLYDWLIVPFVRGQDEEHDEWNRRHSSARMCVERAFGRLKGVWRILSRILWKPKRDRIGPMIFTCCLLHNLMIERGEVINPALLHGVTPHPTGYGPVAVPTRAIFEGGPEARELLYSLPEPDM